jgi:hypothetical protein
MLGFAGSMIGCEEVGRTYKSRRGYLWKGKNTKAAIKENTAARCKVGSVFSRYLSMALA